MAGVYISGMKLPDLKDGGITIFVYPDKKNGGNYIRWMDNNTSDIYAVCGEAISVPDHGRLVDGDKLYAKCDDPYWCVWRSEIEDEPTVIPADGEVE